jgi:hypothetical protein
VGDVHVFDQIYSFCKLYGVLAIHIIFYVSGPGLDFANFIAYHIAKIGPSIVGRHHSFVLWMQRGSNDRYREETQR